MDPSAPLLAIPVRTAAEFGNALRAALDPAGPLPREGRVLLLCSASMLRERRDGTLK